MCKVCVDYQKGTLSAYEALHNLEEMEKTITEDHLEEAVKLIFTSSPDPYEEKD